jgi:hypothetical protein
MFEVAGSVAFHSIVEDLGGTQLVHLPIIGSVKDNK